MTKWKRPGSRPPFLNQWSTEVPRCASPYSPTITLSPKDAKHPTSPRSLIHHNHVIPSRPLILSSYPLQLQCPSRRQTSITWWTHLKSSREKSLTDQCGQKDRRRRPNQDATPWSLCALNSELERPSSPGMRRWARYQAWMTNTHSNQWVTSTVWVKRLSAVAMTPSKSSSETLSWPRSSDMKATSRSWSKNSG